MKLLEVNHLRVSYRAPKHFSLRKSRPVFPVDDVSFSLEQGDSFGLVGESGSGKTTILRALLGLVPIAGGEILFEGRDIRALLQDRRSGYRRSVQMIFQNVNTSLDPKHRIGPLIAEPLRNFERQTAAQRQYAVDELLRMVGLSPKHALLYPRELSGGQRQRVVIARALALRPKLIAADEPVSALDASFQAQVLNCLKDIQAEYGLAYLFVSHDLKVVGHMCGRALVLERGRGVEAGPVEALLSAPAHIYTKRLLAAIPPPDPSLRTGSEHRRALVDQEYDRDYRAYYDENGRAWDLSAISAGRKAAIRKAASPC